MSEYKLEILHRQRLEVEEQLRILRSGRTKGLIATSLSYFFLLPQVDTAKSDKLEHVLVFVIFEILALCIFLFEMTLKMMLLKWEYFLGRVVSAPQ